MEPDPLSGPKIKIETVKRPHTDLFLIYLVLKRQKDRYIVTNRVERHHS